MNKAELIIETEAILKLIKSNSRIGRYLEEIKKVLEEIENDKL